MPNQLAHSKSPYLLQHADNPVEWFEWGEEAFAKARREDKPIFLSVGYSTCHWCHVMAHESFEDAPTAALMNAEFVNIKLDREERPDIDRVYMTFVQATTGHGGWPMSVWLTPELKPFFGGTYFPPEDRFGQPGFRRVIQHVAQAWKQEHEKIAAHGERIISALRDASGGRETQGEIPPQVFAQPYEQFARTFDPREGGFGGAPKFPRPATLNFLTRFYYRSGARAGRLRDSENAVGKAAAEEGAPQSGEHALEMVLLTLRKMAAGGMHDQLGGGFHRYSVDAFWHVPHFEKMLYDQAQLANAYLDAFQITGEAEFGSVARDILEYVRRDMTSRAGGFYSAEDADSEPVVCDGRREASDATAGAHRAPLQEGAFYVWTKREIDQALGDDAPVFCFHFGVEEDGNAPEGADPHGEFTGKNILIERHSVAETAERFGKSREEIEDAIRRAKAALFGKRAQRPRPHLDDKIIAAWNGLMISAFARGAQILDEPAYLETARAAAEFVRAQLWDAERGVLARNFRDGKGVDGFADDYAFMVAGLLDLYESSFDVQSLKFARELQRVLDRWFWDADNGGYFSVTGKDASVLLRIKDDNDSAEPAASSVAALNLARLGALLNDSELAARAGETVKAFALQLTRFPTALPQMLVALDFVQSGRRQIVIAGGRGDERTTALLREVRRRFLPDAVTLLLDGGEESRRFFAENNEVIGAMKPFGDKPAAYVCQNFSCRAPVTEPRELGELLDG